jgi:hypothetical protein
MIEAPENVAADINNRLVWTDLDSETKSELAEIVERYKSTLAKLDDYLGVDTSEDDYLNRLKKVYK